MTRRRAGDPALEPTRDPGRSRQHLADALLAEPDQLEARALVLGLLDEHGAALADRTTAPGHLTGSAVVVDADGVLVPPPSRRAELEERARLEATWGTSASDEDSVDADGDVADAERFQAFWNAGASRGASFAMRSAFSSTASAVCTTYPSVAPDSAVT